MESIGYIFDINLVIRVLSALLLGFVIGLEREMTNKYAGLRTNILVCLGACIFTIISIYGFPTFATGDNVIVSQATGVRDTARIAAQIVAGIGFIGGGTVLRHGANVFGLTTAATLWVSAAVGMACGTGMYGLALVATVLSIMILVSVRLFEKNVLVSSTKNTKRLKMSISCANENSNMIYDYIIENCQHLREITKKLNKQDDNMTKINVILDFVGRNPIQSLYKDYQKLEGVESISIQEVLD